MVKVLINGKELQGGFPNMAHALAFVYQRGECYEAKKVEIIDDQEPEVTETPEITETEDKPTITVEEAPVTSEEPKVTEE